MYRETFWGRKDHWCGIDHNTHRVPTGLSYETNTIYPI